MERTFYALDLDRTLIDTSAVAHDLEVFVQQQDRALGQALQDEQAAVELSGGSFDVLGALGRHVSNEAVQQYVDAFVRQAEGNYLLEGSADLIEKITAKNAHLGILTFGGTEWQQTKLQLSGLGVYPALIVDKKGKKGSLIASWQEAQGGGYRVPTALGGYAVDRVVLVDDKSIEFTGIPEDGTATGYLVGGRRGEPLVSNVIPVASLDEITQREKL